jgi:hypothetical protein
LTEVIFAEESSDFFDKIELKSIIGFVILSSVLIASPKLIEDSILEDFSVFVSNDFWSPKDAHTFFENLKPLVAESVLSSDESFLGGIVNEVMGGLSVLAGILKEGREGVLLGVDVELMPFVEPGGCRNGDATAVELLLNPENPENILLPSAEDTEA